jgi:hypothetical protein
VGASLSTLGYIYRYIYTVMQGGAAKSKNTEGEAGGPYACAPPVQFQLTRLVCPRAGFKDSHRAGTHTGGHRYSRVYSQCRCGATALALALGVATAGVGIFIGALALSSAAAWWSSRLAARHCSSVQLSAAQCSSVQLSAAQCSSVQLSAAQCSSVRTRACHGIPPAAHPTPLSACISTTACLLDKVLYNVK